MIRRGFTLIELALVMGVIALFVSLVGPDYQRMLMRSRTIEARTTIEAISNAERAYFRDHGKYIACAPSLDAPPRGGARAFDVSHPGWKDLGFRADGPHAYQYEVKLNGTSYDVIAHGDLDANGAVSTFILHGDSLKVTVEQELE